jgi:uncharacterized repeat protein (TIGR02543 family)
MITKKLVCNTFKSGRLIALVLTFTLIFTFSPLSGIETYAADAGDNTATAAVINVNQAYTDNLSTSSDVDWFKFTVPEKGKVSVSMTFPYNTKTLYYCYVYPKSGDASDSNTYYMGAGDNATTNTYRLPAGTYYIKITDYSFVNTDYTIKVNYTGEGNILTEAEHNGSTTSATTLTLNSSYTGNLSTSGDVDWFKFTVPEKGKVSVSMTFPQTTKTLYYCYVYPKSGDASDSDTYYMGAGDNVTTNTYRLPAGTYYIKITDYSFVNTDYTIKVNYTGEGSILTEAEHNGSTTSATTLTLNSSYTGNLSTSGDVDWFKFTLSKSAKVRIQMTFPQTTNTLYYCYVYPKSGDASGADTYYMGAGNNAKTNTYKLSAGTYYIRVIDYSFVNTDYKITVQSVYEVKLNANSGVVSPASQQVGANTAVGKLPKATRTGYKFVGWFTAKSGGTKISDKFIVSNNATYYAHWTAKTSTVKFNVNKGKKLSSTKAKKTVTYAKKYGKLPTPTRIGYKFKGWYTDKYLGTKIKASSKVKITKTTTLYAHWKKK